MEQNWTHSSGSTPQFVEAQSLSYTLGAILLLLTILWKNFQSDGTKRRLTFWMSRNLARTTTDSQLGGLEAIGGPKPFPIKLIGNLFHFWPIRKMVYTAVQVCLDNGPVFKISSVNTDFVILNSASAVQTLFKSSSDSHQVKAPFVYDLMKPFITNGVLVSTGKLWHHERKILLRSMSFQSLRAYTTMLNKHSRQLVNALENLFQDGKVHQINELINTSFLEVMCEMITGFDMHGTSEGMEYHHNFQHWKECIAYRLSHPWFLPNPIWNMTSKARRNEKAIEELFKFARRRLAEHKQKRTNITMGKEEIPVHNGNNDDNYTSPLFRNVLDELVDAGVSEDQMVDEINTMLFGGHETGASTIHFFCFVMSLYPDIQEMCRAEVDEAFEDPMQFDGEKLTYDSVSAHLKYLERCILETLRLYPPVFLFLRELQAPLKVDNNGSSVELPVGTNVVVSPFALHRKPEYFTNPEDFNPDRFLPEEVLKRPPQSYIPFSGGPRSCLGMKFGMIEMKMMGAYILRNFTLSTTDRKEDIPLLPNLTLTPERDYSFVFTQRSFHS